MYLIGKTGMGKSTTLENMIVADIMAGNGLAVVDPHGDLVEKIIEFIPANRINDVVYLNPADVDFPIAFNVLETVNPIYRHLVASGMIGVFKKIWADSWGPRLEYLLRNTILALLDYPGSTLLGIPRMYVDNKYRAKVIEAVKDPIIKAFWLDEFNSYSNQFKTEALSPIQNKVGQFLSSSVIRNIVGQSKSTIDMREIMDNKKILLLNLAKGRIGEDNSALLGAMMITKIQLAAMSRVDIPEKDRIDFYLYVDEFQNFATESFEAILSEARKYRLDLIVAHQYIEQLDEKVQAAVFGNVGTIVCFRIGAADAEFLEKEFEPTFMLNDLVNLTKFDMYLKLMIDGVASEPFSATGLPPLPELSKTGNREKIINVSRERYATPRDVVEDKITRWANIAEMEAAANGEFRPGRRTDDRRPAAVLREPRRDVVVKASQPAPETLAPAPPPPPPAEISLSSALKQVPAAFTPSRRPIENRPAASRPPSRPDDRDRNRSGNRPAPQKPGSRPPAKPAISPAPNRPRLVRSSTPSPKPPSPPSADNSTQPTNQSPAKGLMKPGEVIHLD